MPSVFDLLDEIERRPSMFLGGTNEERGAQLRDLEILLMGYGHAAYSGAFDQPIRRDPIRIPEDSIRESERSDERSLVSRLVAWFELA